MDLSWTRPLPAVRVVALEEAPGEPIYISGPEIYRPNPLIYSPGLISVPESGRENKYGA